VHGLHRESENNFTVAVTDLCLFVQSGRRNVELEAGGCIYCFRRSARHGDGSQINLAFQPKFKENEADESVSFRQVTAPRCPANDWDIDVLESGPISEP
jgi:hypothetical protein